MRYEASVIRREGMGGAFCPPTHPMHTESVGSAKGDTFSISLDYALECDYISEGMKRRVRKILDEWEPIPLADLEIRDWVVSVMKYWKNAYRNPQSGSVKVSDLSFDGERNPIEHQDEHGGVIFIRKYYPEFILTSDMMAEVERQTPKR